MKIVILGPPGAGKTTVREKVAQKYDLFEVSTGDAFRSEMAQGSEIGKLARSFIDKGHLVPDDVTLGVVGAQLEGKENYVLDGFPRTVPQAEAFLVSGENIDLVLFFDLDFETAYTRLHSRIAETKAAGGKIRSDDKKEIMHKRFVEFQRKTSPMKEFFSKKETLVEINASLDKDGVWQQVQEALFERGF
ncbi:AAA family ATPase [archaeon]|jgi:adenylate kinase|nr:AAA family ATPase [archaeon]MBT6697490.1 AAA family ATPase [archaeon]